MTMNDNASGQFSVKLALLTAAVGAGFAGPAQAGFISTAGTGFTPVVFDLSQPNSSYALDLDQNGSTDFTISSVTGDNVGIQGSAGNSIAADLYSGSSPAKYANSYTNTSSFVSANSIKGYGNAVIVDSSGNTYLSTGSPYAELVFGDANTSDLRGYIEGTVVSANAASTFTLTDFGYELGAAAVPEPDSLALLAAGAAGLCLLRRRRAERAL